MKIKLHPGKIYVFHTEDGYTVVGTYVRDISEDDRITTRGDIWIKEWYTIAPKGTRTDHGYWGSKGGATLGTIIEVEEINKEQRDNLLKMIKGLRGKS